MPHNSARTALILALCGFATLSIGDALVKTMAGQWPGTAVAALRYSAGAVGLAIVVALTEGRKGFRVPMPWLQLGRGVGVSVATICFFLGVMAIPLADATAIQFTSPMITGMASALLLGEKAPKAVWGATALAFAGVLVVLRPNVLALGAARFLPARGGGGDGLPDDLQPQGGRRGLADRDAIPGGDDGGADPDRRGQPAGAERRAFIPGAGAAGRRRRQMPGGRLHGDGRALLIYMAAVRASAAVVAPMTYVQLLIAAALGWLLFGAAPDLSTFAGAALIIGGGLLLWRSQKPREVPEMPD